MKRFKTILSVFIMLFIFNGIAYGTSGKVIDVIINKKETPVTLVSIVKDGQGIDIGLPSFVNVNRTLIPVRLVEKLGAEVGWDQKTRTAIVKHQGEEIKLTIDSEKATIGNKVEKLDSDSIPRLVIFEDGDARTMVPVSFISKRFGYDVGWNGGTKTVSINTEKLIKPGIGVDIKPAVDLSNKVTKISKELVNGKDGIVIEGTKDVKYKTMNLKNPERIVIDLLDSNLQGSTFYEFKYELGFIEGVRVSQFSPDGNYNPDDKIVRVVLDTKDGAVNPEIKIEKDKDKVLIFPQKNLWDNINYHVEGTGRILTINNYIETNYSVEYDNDKKLMEISIPKKAVNLTKGSSSIRDDLVEDLKIIETSEDMKVVIQFTKDMEYDLISKDRDNKVILKIKEKPNEKPIKKDEINEKEKDEKDEKIEEAEEIIKKPDRKPGERLIVIDPGHGGRDSGAVSPNGVREKDLNMDVSFKLKDALKEKGYSIIMTRETDVFIELRDRSNIANEAFADIFVSIHANAHPNKDAHGMEVLYNPNHDVKNKTKDEERLSKMILDGMLKETGAHSRGIIKRPNLSVLRNTKMPASLVEIGFMSNAREEKLIIDDDYQNKIVSGIIKGIEKYFND